jgi:light-regulated signal transduction histidine kinase (bacteriophytochrome)
LVYANEAAARLVGYPSARALLEAPLQEVLQKFDITDEFGQPFPLSDLPGRRALQGERSPETLVRFRQVETGEERWSVVNATPVFDEQGRVRLAVNLLRDITEHKRAEEEIRKLNEQLEQRVRRRTVQLETFNREFEAFSYSVSHDLRAPLRSIDGFSQILFLEDHAEELDEDGKDYLERVRAASQRMAQLIDDLLNLSRLVRSEMRHEKVDLSTLVEGLAEELKQSEPRRPVEFIIEGGLVVEGDRRLLRVALENLLRNAWKFTGKQPRAKIEFGVSEHEDTPAYFVRDNGVGFNMAYADKLFGAFQRLHSVNEFEGTGIGLATVQRIIHRHGGLVWAEGQVNHGATFYFTL